jgi:uncharacterized coiled-coil DUF342 family protein
MDQELKDSLDQIRRHLTGLSDEARQNRALLEKQHDEIQQVRGEIRQTREQLHDEIQQTRDQLHDENQQTRILLEGEHEDIRQLAEGLIGTNERLDSFRAEIAIQFDQMKSFISLPYKDMDGRVKVLESWKELSERDPVEIVRERYGRPKA